MQDDTKPTGINASTEPAPTQSAPEVPHKPAPITDNSPSTANPPKEEEGIASVTPIVLPAEPSVVKEDVVPKDVSPDVKKSIEEQLKDVESLLDGFAAKRVIIEDQSTSSFSERKQLEDSLAPILLKEKLVVEELREFGEKESAAKSKDERRELSRQRWSMEEKRRLIEAEKWPISENLEAVEKSIKESERAFMALASEENRVRADIARLKIEAQQRDLRAELDVVGGEKGVVEDELSGLRAEHERLTQLIADIRKKEKEFADEELKLDERANSVGSAYEERVLAEKRHKIEEDRRISEEAEWKAEDAVGEVIDSEKKSAAALKTISAKEAAITAKLKDLE